MQDLVSVKGMVIKCEPIGEYDRRVVILTLEKGKISCFAKGARKINNRFMASTNPFSFGDFKLYAGKNSYSLNDAVITNYFEDMRTDFDKACYGMYFLEIADYYARENNDERELLKLLYQGMRALVNSKIDNKLARIVFELKAIIVNGEYPGMPTKDELAVDIDESTEYALKFIQSNPIEKVFNFAVIDSVYEKLRLISQFIVRKTIDKPFKSLEILDNL